MQLDLESFACVEEFAQKFCSRFPSLDILILNAGSLMLERKITGDGLESMMQINCFSPFLLALLLLKSLRKRLVIPTYVKLELTAPFSVRSNEVE